MNLLAMHTNELPRKTSFRHRALNRMLFEKEKQTNSGAMPFVNVGTWIQSSYRRHDRAPAGVCCIFSIFSSKESTKGSSAIAEGTHDQSRQGPWTTSGNDNSVMKRRMKRMRINQKDKQPSRLRVVEFIRRPDHVGVRVHALYRICCEQA